MMNRLIKIVAAATMLAAMQATQAQEPIDGLWFNPAESGRGWTLDSQQGTLVVTFFVYDDAGMADWYQAAGPLTNNFRRFSAPANHFSGGQAWGGTFMPPTVDDGADIVKIRFSSRIKGVLTWRGKSVPIVRQDFGFGRGPESMLGEWVLAWGRFDARRLLFTQVGPSIVEGGTGTFVSENNRSIGECRAADGVCAILTLNADGTVLDAYGFDNLTGEIVGVHISAINVIKGMNGFQVSPLSSGTSRSLARPSPDVAAALAATLDDYVAGL